MAEGPVDACIRQLREQLRTIDQLILHLEAYERLTAGPRRGRPRKFSSSLVRKLVHGGTQRARGPETLKISGGRLS